MPNSTLRAIIGLVKPYSWLPASILPTLFAAALSLGAPTFSAGLFYALLIIAILLHSSVNTLNDYSDFVKGTDTAENSADNAIIIYHLPNAKMALTLGIAFLALAAALGIYVIAKAGPVPLIIGIFSGMVVVTYSAGPLPLSYLPLGEAVSGLAMGGLLPLAVYAALNGGRLYWPLLLYALPLMLGVGLIMMTNNISDIERDRKAGRRTLPLLLGRQASRTLYRALLTAWPAALLLLVGCIFTGGLFVLPLGLLCGYKSWWRLLGASLTPAERSANMAAIFQANMIINTTYTLAVLVNLARG